MGLKLGARAAATILCGLIALPAPVQAQLSGADRPAVGTEISIADDSDETTVTRVAIDLDLRTDGDAKRFGVRLENVWYELLGAPTEQRQRVFLQAGDKAEGWTWAARVGTDGDNVIGSASVYDDSRFRKELFIERDIVETPLGLQRRLYSTFGGAAIDLPLNERNTLTVLGGLQEFSGDNERLHLRANYVYVVSQKVGLSAQLRGRYFHNTEPREFDYFSPRNFVQAMPVVQIRRFVNGWQLLAVGGIGAQRFTASQWQQANHAELSARSPQRGPWRAGAQLVYSNTPGSNALQSDEYTYIQGRATLSRSF